MKRNSKEKLSDAVMGQAILALVDAGEAISFDALIATLRLIAKSEKDDARKEACEHAISEILTSTAATAESKNEQAAPADQGWQSYGNNNDASKRKVH